MARNSNAGEGDFYEDDRRMARPSASRNGRLATYDNAYDDYDDLFDDEEDDDDYYEDDGPMAGNFWSNPDAKTSRREREPRRFYEDEEDDLRRRPPRRQSDRPARRRSPAPTSFGEPPKVFKDLYDQLFWYGFDIDESAQVGDNTVFGGTKGKFNGFNYLLPEQDDGERSRPSRNSARRLPPSRNGSSGTLATDSGRRPRRNVESDYYLNGDGDEYDDDGDDEEDDYDRVEEPIKKRKPRTSSEYTPPSDRTSTRYDSIDEYDNYDNYDEDEYMDTRRRSRRKSSSRYNDDDEYNDRRSGGRRRRRQQSSGTEWSPLNMIESFLGIDKDEMDYKADEYNAKMGLGKRRRPSGDDERNSRRRSPARRRSARDDPERPGYAYRYDATLDDESTPILDVDPAETDDSDIPESKRRQLALDTDERKSRKKERSWEERQIAMERVPPIDVVAWGPSGELPMSAREKAFMDAQEDIETARRKLNLMKKKESEAKEEITILKVDADRQRLKLREAPRERRSQRDIEELRQIELDIDDASRDLRSSRAKVERATEKLEELEERHHAIMSCYNIDQASSLVGETLNSFSTSVQGSGTASSSSLSDFSDSSAGDKIESSDTDDSNSDGSGKRSK
eukprot:CAMPEP_0116115084 /NCGR_PEP_ID=MMETSP0329-20121206/320_1 /TAXON_ID=697910 /ORGANISM="Pseudo-nitzschia arenysensis, Strain B593" /LENGTH=623 /DNA_ID=CAMNT_0003608497 /DNA_START=207 /DNA_END=2079 /DNA_ORIENTATION=-